MLGFCNHATRFNETPSPLFMGHGIFIKKLSLVVQPIIVYVDRSFSHEVPLCITDRTSNEGNLVDSSSDFVYSGGGLLLLSDSSSYHHRELVSIGNNTDYTASYVHATMMSLLAGSYALSWFFTWDMNRNHRFVPREYKIRVLNSYYGVVSFSMLVWIQKVVGTPTNGRDPAWWIEIICWVGYIIVLGVTFRIHNPVTDSGFLDIAIGIGSSCFILDYISKWAAVPFYTVVCVLIFIRNHFEDILRVARLKSPPSEGLPETIFDVKEHSNHLPPLSPLRRLLLEFVVDGDQDEQQHMEIGDQNKQEHINRQQNGDQDIEEQPVNGPQNGEQHVNQNNHLPTINGQVIDVRGIDGPQPEIVEPMIHPQVINPQNDDQGIDGPQNDDQEVIHPHVINPQNGDQGIDGQENDGPQDDDDQEEIGELVIHPQVINPPSLGSRSNGCKQVAEMEIECGDSMRLLFTEEFAEMDIEYGDRMKFLFAEEVAEMDIEYRDSMRLLFAEEVAEMDIEYGDSMRLLFAEEVAEMDIEYGDSMRLLFAEEVAEMDIEYGDSMRLLFAEEVAEIDIEYGDSMRLLFAEEGVSMDIDGDSMRLPFADMENP